MSMTFWGVARRWALKPAFLATVGLAILVAISIRIAIAITAFDPADAPIGHVSQDEVTNFNLKSGQEVLFRGQYEREFWSGTLLAYRLTESGDVQPSTSWWTADAGEIISAQNFNTGRFISTMKDDGTAVAFRLTNLSAAQQAHFPDGSPQFDYVRGDRSMEINAGGPYRQRVSVMGAVIHSRPLFVADDTNPTVFVGANDGMLHAINATNGASGGAERWAYVPSMLIPKLQRLTAEPYVNTYFVDGQINVATIVPDPTGAPDTTRRVLVGGLGAGGKGLYALNIDSLTAANEAGVNSKVMWELTPTAVNYAAPTTANAYDNLGYTYGTVTIAKVRVGGVKTDAVIIGNGYNDGGDYGSYLFVINAATGQLIKRFKAGNGTILSPNGLSTPAAIDDDRDGVVDRVYAGDLDGTMWRFDLSDANLTDPTTVAAVGTGVTALLTTDGNQAITSTPGIGIHPEGGYMITFGTGKALIASDLDDATVHFVYGIWDGAPVANNVLLEQTLSERDYTGSASPLRVRRTTSNAPVWVSGAGNHKGWKVALPAGERVLGEGTFIENGRFYFTSYNPTKSSTITGTATVVKGDNWLMELDYLTGGSSNQPFLDLSGNIKLDDADRLKYITGDTIPLGKNVGDPIMTTDGIPVGKFISIGVLSQPILVQLITLNDTLFNQNPDVIVPSTNVDRGVKGGHFDVEIYYGTTTATITVNTAPTTVGQTSNFPATLGAITVDGEVIVPALGITDLTNGGGSASTSASAIRGKVTPTFKASRSGNVITITAPDVSYIGKTITVAEGSTQALIAPVGATALVSFTGTTGAASVLTASLGGPASVMLGTTVVRATNLTLGNNRTAAQVVATIRANIGTGGIVKAYTGGNAVTPACAAQPVTTMCLVDTSKGPEGDGILAQLGTITNSGTLAVTYSAPAGGVSKSGWTNFKAAVTVTTFDNGGGSADIVGDTCNGGKSRCTYKEHDHEFDDIYDKTGVNFLNSSNSNFNLARAIPSMSTQFKVIAQNQYLSPAVNLHIGNSGYLFNVDAGYIPIKQFTTSATLDLASLPTYTRATIGSLAFNLPATAFTHNDWWGGYLGLPADVRDGLHPTEAGCVFRAESAPTVVAGVVTVPSQDGNMYRPVIPPSTVTASGNGTRGWGPTQGPGGVPTTELTAQGVRHNGALTLQIIRADTPNSAIELSIPGQPEYGWRVKAAEYARYVIASYSTFHHTKHLGLCYGDENVTFTLYGVTYTNVSWSKIPVTDTRTCGGSDTSTTKKCAVDLSASAGPDPKIGNLGGGSNITSTVTTTVGDVTTTTITYESGAVASIVRTVNADGSITIVSRDVLYEQCILTKTPAECQTTQTIANKSGAVKSGGDERGLQAKTGRISWRELIAP